MGCAFCKGISRRHIIKNKRTALTASRQSKPVIKQSYSYSRKSQVLRLPPTNLSSLKKTAERNRRVFASSSPKVKKSRYDY